MGSVWIWVNFVSSCNQVDTKQTFSEHSVEQTIEALEMQYDLQVLQAIREVGEAAVTNHSHLIVARSPLKRHASEFELISLNFVKLLLVEFAHFWLMYKNPKSLRKQKNMAWINRPPRICCITWALRRMARFCRQL